jgi:Bacterial Ig domain
MKACLSLLFACVFLPMVTARAAISIGGGIPIWQTFPTAPLVGEWSTLSVGGEGGNASIRTPDQMDLEVQYLSAVDVNRPLATDPNIFPTQNNYARVNLPGQYAQMRIGNNAYTVLMATLNNDTPDNLASLSISFDFGGGLFIAEEIPGWRTYFSLTGQPFTWENIPALNTLVPGSYSAVIDLGFWVAGSPLYLLWVDDNSASGSDGYYTLDNLLLGTTNGVSIGEPANGQTFRHGSNITVVASGFLPGTITNLTFLLDGMPVASGAVAPFRTALTGVTLGQHQLTAVGQDALGNSATSAIVSFTVTPNLPAIRVLPGGTGVLTFDYQPTPSDGWTTLSVAGSFGDITNAAGLDALVQTLASSNINAALRIENTFTPDAASIVSWHSVRQNLLSRTVGNRFCVLLAVLQNHTGGSVRYLELSYDFFTPVTNVVEDVPGLRAYRSLSGAPGSWQLIPDFTTDTGGRLTAGLNLGTWPAGANLFILWADDNGPASGQGYTGEGAYYLDNFSATLRPSLSITMFQDYWVKLSWPEAATGFEIEASDTPAGGLWVPVLDPVVPSGGRNHVITDRFLEGRFFRLAKP